MTEIYEYGYLNFVDVTGSGIAVVVEADAMSAEIYTDGRLSVLNRLGRSGWVINEGGYSTAGWPQWISDCISRDIRPVGELTRLGGITTHFMRRRVASEG